MAILSLDPYRALELVTRILPRKDNLIIKKLNTIKIIPKDISRGPIIEKLIYNEILKRYPKTELKRTRDGNILKIRAISNGVASIHISVPKKVTPSVLRPGEAYELYFESVILDGLKNLKELRENMDIPLSIFDMYHNLTLLINAGGKQISIGPIKSVDKVGQEGKKADVIITLKTGKRIKISLKQKNFFSWGSAGTYDSVYSARPREILDKAIQNGLVTVDDNQEIIFPPNIKGIRLPATKSEIKKYAFGDSSNNVDYIVINAGKVNYNENTKIIYMTGTKIYKNNTPKDLNEMSNDVYMVIYKIKGNSTAMRPYKNVSVMYVNKNHAYNALDQSKYMDISL